MFDNYKLDSPTFEINNRDKFIFDENNTQNFDNFNITENNYRNFTNKPEENFNFLVEESQESSNSSNR